MSPSVHLPQVLKDERENKEKEDKKRIRVNEVRPHSRFMSWDLWKF